MINSNSPKHSRSPTSGGPLGSPSKALPNFTPPSKHAIPPSSYGQPMNSESQIYNKSPQDRNAVDRSPTKAMDGRTSSPDGQSTQVAAILIRRLPHNTSKETLISMLLFAEDLVDANFVNIDIPEDGGWLCAIARFRTWDGAHETRHKLHGKPNAANDATMVVELLPASGNTAQSNGRKLSEGQLSRQLSTSASSGGSSAGHNNRQSSRFNGAFQSMDRISPINTNQNMSNGELTDLESRTHLQQIFGPQSPLATTYNERPRVSGKSMINDDSADDETGELLKDPVAYAKSGQGGSTQRRSTNPQATISRFASLSLNTNDHLTLNSHPLASPTGAGFGPSRNHSMASPVSDMAQMNLGNSMPPLSPTGSFPISPPHYQRHHYPPANPADQNPPCNTLYVGNLPVDTSEDELKAMFSKQRGYKRLCFRTKHNGPMCFVEFEDVSFATKALNDLYGQPLHNSVKGGIRLSFSKNPLGVRTGQPNNIGPQSPLSSPGGMSGLGSMGAPPGFTTANGPPPGLSLPPGLNSNMSMGAGSSNHQNIPNGFFGGSSGAFPASPPHGSMKGQSLADGGFQSGSGNFPDYMLGR